jgi:hypothetical protein
MSIWSVIVRRYAVAIGSKIVTDVIIQARYLMAYLCRIKKYSVNTGIS